MSLQSDAKLYSDSEHRQRFGAHALYDDDHVHKIGDISRSVTGMRLLGQKTNHYAFQLPYRATIGQLRDLASWVFGGVVTEGGVTSVSRMVLNNIRESRGVSMVRFTTRAATDFFRTMWHDVVVSAFNRLQHICALTDTFARFSFFLLGSFFVQKLLSPLPLLQRIMKRVALLGHSLKSSVMDMFSRVLITGWWEELLISLGHFSEAMQQLWAPIDSRFDRMLAWALDTSVAFGNGLVNYVESWYSDMMGSRPVAFLAHTRDALVHLLTETFITVPVRILTASAVNLAQNPAMKTVTTKMGRLNQQMKVSGFYSPPLLARFFNGNARRREQELATIFRKCEGARRPEDLPHTCFSGAGKFKLLRSTTHVCVVAKNGKHVCATKTVCVTKHVRV